MTDRLDRREFFARAALGVAALGTACVRGSTVVAGEKAATMFVSLPPWAVARNVPWPDQARLAASIGYKGIDFDFGPAKQAGVEATTRLLAELRIVATICNLPMNAPLGRDDNAFEAQLPALAENAAFARAIGCSRFQLVLGPTTLEGQTKQQRWTQVQRRLSAVAAVLDRHRVRLGLEFLGPRVFREPPRTPFVWTLRETLALCEASGPNVGVTLDAWHWYHSGSTTADIRTARASRIVHVHVSDARPMPPEDVRDDMRLLPGEGEIDLVGFFQALQAIGYRGGVAPETIGPRIPARMPAAESARIALEATTAVMRKAGVA